MDDKDKYVVGMEHFGETLKKKRHEAKLTQRELADLAGCSYQLIGKYETGSIANVPLHQIDTIAKCLGTTLSALLLDGSDLSKAERIKILYESAPSHIQLAIEKLLDI